MLWSVVEYVLRGLEVFLLLSFLLKLIEDKQVFKPRSQYLDASTYFLFLLLLIDFSVKSILILDRTDRYIAYFVLILLILMTSMTCLIFNLMNRLYKRTIEKKQLEEVLKIKDKYYEAIKNDQLEIRSIRHNLKNQLIIVQRDIKEQKWVEVEKSVNTLLGNIVETENYHFTKHIGINVVLNEKLKEAKKYQIHCHFEVHVPETVHISAIDLGILLGNPLDNAIEACQKVEKKRRTIYLRLIYYQQTLVLSIINSAKQVNNLLTDKEDKKNHGLGIRSIEKVVKKYNGSMDIFMENQAFRLDINLWNV